MLTRLVHVGLQQSQVLTILKCSDGLALLAVFTVSNVISGFYAELVRSERLQPLRKEQKVQCVRHVQLVLPYSVLFSDSANNKNC